MAQPRPRPQADDPTYSVARGFIVTSPGRYGKEEAALTQRKRLSLMSGAPKAPPLLVVPICVVSITYLPHLGSLILRLAIGTSGPIS